MFLRLLNILLRLLRIIESVSRVRHNLNQVGSLIMHLCVDFLCDRIDVCHELLNIIKFVLPLLDNLLHLIGLSPDFELFQVELLLLQELLVVFVLAEPTNTHGAIIIHHRLASLDQV